MLLRIFMCIVLASLIASCGKKPPEGVALIVNGEQITSDEVNQAAQLLRQGMVAAFPEKAVEGVTDELVAGAARQLIANRLLADEARRRGIQADSAAVDSACNSIIKGFPDQATFERELIKMGETDSSFRDKIAEGVRLDGLMQTLLANVREIDTQECRDFYGKNHDNFTNAGRVRAGQIFFPYPDSVSEAQKAQVMEQARKVKERLAAGENFAELAKKHSKGPGALDGGDIGWFKKGDLRPDLEGPLFLLKKDEVSDIVITDAGLFLLCKTDEESAVPLPFEEVHERIRFLLAMNERNAFLSRHVDSLISKAKIEYVDTTLARKEPSEGFNGLPGLNQ